MVTTIGMHRILVDTNGNSIDAIDLAATSVPNLRAGDRTDVNAG